MEQVLCQGKEHAGRGRWGPSVCGVGAAMPPALRAERTRRARSRALMPRGTSGGQPEGPVSLAGI
eukprot:11543469-Heterocapsa_arctica.AAC.1